MAPVLTYRDFSILASVVEFMVIHPGLFTVTVEGHPGNHMPTCPFLATISGDIQCHPMNFVQNSYLEGIANPPMSCCGEMAILQMLEGENDEKTDARHSFHLPLVDANLNVPFHTTLCQFSTARENFFKKTSTQGNRPRPYEGLRSPKGWFGMLATKILASKSATGKRLGVD